MKSTSHWKSGFESIVDNGRNHTVTVDLPEAKGGNNNGPTALELCVMSFSSCIGTIFSMLAHKMRLEFTELDIILEANQAAGAASITDVYFELCIKTSSTEDQVKKCLDLTVSTCPVGVLFRQAGVKIEYEIEII